MALEFNKPRFLLCEGPDDKKFFQTLLAQRAGMPDFQVCHAAEFNNVGQGGRSGFRLSLDSSVRILSGFGGLKAILIVSDNDRASSFQEVQQELTAAGHTPPATVNDLGTLLGKPVAVLMMPSANIFGDLESLSLPAIYQTWPKARICVPLFLRCTGALKYFGGANWTKPSSVNKARARAASVGFYEDDPYKGLGLLFQNGTIPVGHSCFDEVADFLHQFDAFCHI